MMSAEEAEALQGDNPCHCRTLGLMGAPGWLQYKDKRPDFCQRKPDMDCTCCVQCCSCGG